jgi:hypothetical protein
MKGRWGVASPQASSHKTTNHEREPHGAKRERGRQGHAEETMQLIFTLNTATGAVAKMEKIDGAGKRREVEKEETLKLVGKDNFHEIEAALDEAFEAGISSIFEAEGEDDESPESEEETEIRRILLTGMVGRNVRQRLQRRLVQRLILSRTLKH